MHGGGVRAVGRHGPRARRAGFGVTGPEVDAALTSDWPAYVGAALVPDPDADPGAVATPMPALAAPRAPGKGATPAARKEFFRRARPSKTACCRAGGCGAWSPSSSRSHEKLTLLWHNHFATSAQKVRVASHMAAQNQKLRTLDRSATSARWRTRC